MAGIIPVPFRALRRLKRQALHVDHLHSTQQQFSFQCSTFAALGAYLATPGNDCTIEVTDTNHVLPYTVLDFELTVTPGSPAFWSASYADFWLTAADSTAALAAITLAGQFNQYFGLMRQHYPAFASGRARANGNELFVELPWGVLGTTSVTATGPLGPEALTNMFPGVDNPLWFGIVGMKRHCFRVPPRYPGPYYGNPIG